MNVKNLMTLFNYYNFLVSLISERKKSLFVLCFLKIESNDIKSSLNSKKKL